MPTGKSCKAALFLFVFHVQSFQLSTFICTFAPLFNKTMQEQFEMIAKTFMGLETVLAEELNKLGANEVQIVRRMVSFTVDKEMM